MCGRAYETYTEEELAARYFTEKRKRNPLGQFKTTFNLAPTQFSPVILVRDKELELDFFRWGLIPSWAKDPKDASKYSLINAKSEELSEKRSYKEPFKHRRCVVPVSGFYEWKRQESGPKKPFAIHSKKEPILSLAAIWEHWKSKETGEEIYSFSIITCAPNSLMEQIHNRMPVILDRADELDWLNPENNSEDLKKLLKPCPSDWLNVYEISALVNSPKNNSSDILSPI